MSVSVTCSCGRMLEAADDQAGKTVLCPHCGLVVTVPYDGLIILPIVRPPARSWKAVAALVLGLTSLGLWIFEPVPALILGVGSLLLAAIAIVELRRSGGRLHGQGLALGGITATILGIVLIGPAVERMREVSAMVD